MARLVSLLISQTHQRALVLLLWVALFALTLAILAAITAQQVTGRMLAEANKTLEQHHDGRMSLFAAFDALETQVTGEPCGELFQSQLRKIAFMPDGLNEFLYVQGRTAICSVSVGRLAQPYDLGEPSIEAETAGGMAVWLDRPLDFAGLRDLTGTIVVRGSFGIVTPPLPLTEVGWMDQEVVVVMGDRWIHRRGESGLYQRIRGEQGRVLFPILSGAFHQLACDEGGLVCVAGESKLGGLFVLGGNIVVVGVVISLLISAWLAGQLNTIIRRYWSFEARFRRNFNAQNIFCVYQPIIAVATGEVAGFEVLVRWRDLDGSIAMPDKFLPIVEKRGMTMQLTRLVVQRAAEDLSECVPRGQRLQVLFNIFPRDLDSQRLTEVMSVFDPVRDRFDLVVELVENDQVRLDTAQREIGALRARGIRTFIDDFGSGYSNIANLAALSVDGVKLDRAFAMSPDGSLMAQLLGNIIDMIHGSGRTIIVEGIETAERLEAIRATGRVDYAQGYFISRPLDIAQVPGFLAARKRKAAPEPARRRPSTKSRRYATTMGVPTGTR